MSTEKISVLFVCTHNSSRSPMAEAFLKHYGGERFSVESAGLEAGTLNPIMVKAMAEAGIDISHHIPQDAFDLYKQGRRYNYVITVCDESNSSRCPVFPGMSKRLHWSFEDPAAFTGTHDERLQKTRKVRDAIESAVKIFIQEFSPIPATNGISAAH